MTNLLEALTTIDLSNFPPVPPEMYELVEMLAQAGQMPEARYADLLKDAAFAAWTNARNIASARRGTRNDGGDGQSGSPRGDGVMAPTRSQLQHLAGLIVDVLNTAQEVENYGETLSTRIDSETHRRLRNLRQDADRLRTDMLQRADSLPAEL